MRNMQILLFLFSTSISIIYASTTENPVDSELDGFVAAADHLKLGMNTEIQPCESFYGFACGNLGKNIRAKEPNVTSYSGWNVVSSNFTRKIVKLLDDIQPNETPIPDVAKRIKIFWNKCLNRHSSSEAIVDSVQYAVEFTSQLGGSPLFDSTWEEPEQSIFHFAIEAQKKVGVEFGLSIAVSEDQDVGRNVMYMFFSSSLMNPSSVIEIHEKFAELAGRSPLDEEAKSAQETEMRKARSEVYKVLEEIGYSYSWGYKKITLKDVYENFPDLAQGIADQGVENSSHIFVRENSIRKVKALLPLLGKYSKYRKPLQNFLIGAYLAKVASHLNISTSTTINQTSTLFKNLDRSGDHGEYFNKGIKDLPESTQHCLETAVTSYSTGLFEHGVLRLFVEKYGPSQEEVLKLRQMVDLVREELRKKVFRASWLDFHSKIRAMNKLSSIIPRIAYPLWIVNNTAMNAYYRAVGSVSENDSYLKILSQAHGNKFLNYLNLLNRPVAQDYNSFGMSSFYVNAWYQGDRNAFALSLGILQPPFYRPDYPPALIYAITGAITGHEIVHGFDRSGVETDLEGNSERWMSEQSYEEFNNRAECVEEQYSKFCYNLTTLDSYRCVSGTQTASENIADIDGLKAAYTAYKSYMEGRSASADEKKLPGLESYSWEQIFFMGYATAWCQMESDEDISGRLGYDSHSPGPSRVNGTMQNLPSFSEAFNCPFGSRMNPTDKCIVW